MFELSSSTIDPADLSTRLADPGGGALATFEGRVRNHNEGKEVSRLEYEAYEALALKEGDKIIEEVRTAFPVLYLNCVHRTGSLDIGDIAVWVGVLSVHRGEAFDACRYHKLAEWPPGGGT